MALNGQPPRPPGYEGYCAQSVYRSSVGPACVNDATAASALYFPIYPCYTPTPLVVCTHTYTGDGIVYDGPGRSHPDYLYNLAEPEGHDIRKLVFSGGSHTMPGNEYDWIVGCLGIVAQCASSCEVNLTTCVGSHRCLFDPGVVECGRGLVG